MHEHQGIVITLWGEMKRKLYEVILDYFVR